MQTPPAWRQAIDALLHGVARGPLAERAERISTLYRDGTGSAFAVRDATDALAYTLTRSPATYAAVHNTLERLRERAPGFVPNSVLDLGAGSGAASWAAAALWPEARLTQLDQNRPLLDLGRKLASEAPAAALRNAQQHVGDLTQPGTLPEADVVLVSYMLAELNSTQLEQIIKPAWEHTTGALVLVEPGTPAGYRRILRARDLLLAQGARILAPCPHERACPLTPPDWCHFAQRVERSRDHRLLKGADLPYEDEKFSYLVAVREAFFTPAAHGRILARPATDAALIQIKLCSVEGALEPVRVSRRDKEAHKRAKKKSWGDEL